MIPMFNSSFCEVSCNTPFFLSKALSSKRQYFKCIHLFSPIVSRIIRSTMFEASAEMDPNVGWLTMYSVYNFLLCTLQVLHIIWFYYICLIAADAFKGQVGVHCLKYSNASLCFLFSLYRFGK